MSDPLFQGMTRPAMLAGVTYSGVILNMMIVSIPFIGLNNIFLALLALPIHGAMMVACRWDARVFDLLAVWSRTTGKARLRHFWGGSTYRP